MGYSFVRALHLAAPNALEPYVSVCGWDPEKAKLRREAKTIMDGIPLIKVAKDLGLEAIVFDDFSFLAEQTFDHIERNARNANNKFKLWGDLREVTLEFRDAARYAGVHVALNAWEQAPSWRGEGEKRKYVRGGPKLPSDLPDQVPAMCDMVFRGGYEPMRKPWPGVYVCRPDSEWNMKNRFNSTPEISPMNLGEILRHSGYTISRHPGLPEQEAWVESIATAMLKAGPTGDREIGVQALVELRKKGLHEKHITWTLRDAIDRVALKRATASHTSESAFGWV
jgi:hypothetical protein